MPGRILARKFVSALTPFYETLAESAKTNHAMMRKDESDQGWLPGRRKIFFEKGFEVAQDKLQNAFQMPINMEICGVRDDPVHNKATGNDYRIATGPRPDYSWKQRSD
jgi:hypothetical protein